LVAGEDLRDLGVGDVGAEEDVVPGATLRRGVVELVAGIVLFSPPEDALEVCLGEDAEGGTAEVGVDVVVEAAGFGGFVPPGVAEVSHDEGGMGDLAGNVIDSDGAHAGGVDVSLFVGGGAGDHAGVEKNGHVELGGTGVIGKVGGIVVGEAGADELEAEKALILEAVHREEGGLGGLKIGERDEEVWVSFEGLENVLVGGPGVLEGGEADEGDARDAGGLGGSPEPVGVIGLGA